MGSVARLERAPGNAKPVLLMIRQHVQDRAMIGKEPDLKFICRLLDDAIRDPQSGRAVLLGLSEFLGAATVGVTIDLLNWIPPRL